MNCFRKHGKMNYILEERIHLIWWKITNWRDIQSHIKIKIILIAVWYLQVEISVKNTQLSLSHSCTIVLSVCRCQGITKCKITETVVTSVSTLCNAIFKIDKTSRAWNFYPIGWFSNLVELRCDNENCFTIKFQVLNTWVYSSGSSTYMCRKKLDKEINISFNSLCKKLWSLPKPSKIE